MRPKLKKQSTAPQAPGPSTPPKHLSIASDDYFAQIRRRKEELGLNQDQAVALAVTSDLELLRSLDKALLRQWGTDMIRSSLLSKDLRRELQRRLGERPYVKELMNEWMESEGPEYEEVDES